MKTMKVIVAGATGYLGGKIVKALLEANAEVTAMVRATSNRSKLEEMGVKKFVIGDMMNKESLKLALSAEHGFNAIVASAAGYTRHSKGDNPKTDTTGYQNLVDAAIAATSLPDPVLNTAVDVGWSSPVNENALAAAFEKVLNKPFKAKPVIPSFVVSIIVPIMAKFSSNLNDMLEMVKWVKSGDYVSKNTRKQRELFADLPTIEEAVRRYCKDNHLIQ